MFSKGIHKRIKIVFLVIIFVFVIIIGKVFYIEVVEYGKLNTLACKNGSVTFLRKIYIDFAKVLKKNRTSPEPSFKIIITSGMFPLGNGSLSVLKISAKKEGILRKRG